jgi:hypothetical protein
MHDEYTELDQLLHEEGFMKHKLRYEQRFRPVLSSLLTSNYRNDYFPSTEQFVLRMPSVLHEAITTSVIGEILRQLRSIAGREGLSAGFAQAIEHGGSVHIVFNDLEYGTHEPDALFRRSRAQYPGVVFEISYS